MEIFKLFGSIMVNNDQANHSLDATDKKAQGTSKSFGGMIASAAKMGAGIALAVGGAALAVGGLAVSFTGDLKKALNIVQVQTGATDGAMVDIKDTMVAIYNANLGENFEDIGRAIAEVGKQTGATGVELEDMTKDALILRDALGLEVQESVRTVDMMMKSFGVTSEEAFNLIAQGSQQGLDKNGGLLDSINEYSVHFEQLGFDSEEMFNSMANGAKSGVYDIDKLGDAIKEFGIRSKDGSKASSEAFQTLGLDASEMSLAFAKGGDSAKDAFDKTAAALISLESPLEKEAAGVALFGTMWEDIGVKGMEALMGTEGEINKNIDALGKINEVHYDTFGQAVQGIKRNLETGILLPLGESIMPALNKMAGWIQTNMPAIQNEIKYAMGIAKQVFDVVGNVVQTFIMPQFRAFGTLISTNMPAIRGAIAAMYNYVKPSFDRLVATIKSDLMPIISGLWSLVQSAMPTIRTLFEVAMIAIGATLKIAMEVISGFIKVANGIYNTIQPGVQSVVNIFNKVADAIQWALDKLRFWNNTDAKDKNTTVTTHYRNVSTATTMDDRLGNNAQGTDYWKGGLTWVGEEGPELIDAPRGSQIFSNEKSKAMANGGGLTLYIQNLYNNRPQSIEELAQELEMYRLMHSKALGGA